MEIKVENEDLIITELEYVSGKKEMRDGDMCEMIAHIHVIPLDIVGKG